MKRHRLKKEWETALSGSGPASIDVHTPLWLWNQAGFPELVLSKTAVR